MALLTWERNKDGECLGSMNHMTLFCIRQEIDPSGEEVRWKINAYQHELELELECPYRSTLLAAQEVAEHKYRLVLKGLGVLRAIEWTSPEEAKPLPVDQYTDDEGVRVYVTEFVQLKCWRVIDNHREDVYLEAKAHIDSESLEIRRWQLRSNDRALDEDVTVTGWRYAFNN